MTSLTIPIAAIAVPALLGLLYFFYQSYLERRTVTIAIHEEMERLREVLRTHDTWIKKPGSQSPLVPFETVVYDAQLQTIGLLDSKFVQNVVALYSMVHFINAFQRAKPEYDQIEGGNARFLSHIKRHFIEPSL